jgi:hypothetical protein
MASGYGRREDAGPSGGGDPEKVEHSSLVSEKAVADYYKKLRPGARKPLEQAENNYAEALLL